MRITELEGRRVGVWGAGREGLAAVNVLLPGDGWAGAGEILVHTDDAPADGEDLPAGVVRVHGPGGLDELARCDVVVRSPGVSRYLPEVGALAEAGVELTTGTNLWHDELAGTGMLGDTIAVTGTKGKSTTASLIAHLLSGYFAGELPVELRGNIGTPLLTDVMPGLMVTGPPVVTVLEVSSYQTSDFEGRVDLAVFTNLYSEHLNWHGSTDVYRRDKLRLADHAGTVVANSLDERLAAAFGDREGVIWFGGLDGWRVNGDGIANDGLGASVGADDLPVALRDAHMRLNLCAALTVLDIETGGRHSSASDRVGLLSGFVPLPHRVQDLGLGDSGGWRFVNDSIATAPQAVVAALDAVRDRYPGQPVALLAGGFDRGQGYAEIAERVNGDQLVAAVVGLPATGADVIAEVGAQPDPPQVLTLAEDMAEAVAAAKAALPDGGVVLLSPGAPSFGAYSDFEERGRDFAAAAGLPWPEEEVVGEGGPGA